MVRRKKVYEGKGKILYEGPEPGTLIQYFKDEDTGPANVSPITAATEGKGVLNNRLSEFFMTGLNNIGVPTHFMRRVNMREQMVRMAEMLPMEIVVRNFAAGGITERLGIPAGVPLPRPIIEYYYKDDKLGCPLVSEEHIVAFGWANQQDLEDVVSLAMRVNDFLSGAMLASGVRLMDFRIEVGRVWEGEYMRLLLADEITPDSMTLWDLRQPELADGTMNEPAPLNDAYSELARRLGVLPSNVTHSAKSSILN